MSDKKRSMVDIFKDITNDDDLEKRLGNKALLRKKMGISNRRIFKHWVLPIGFVSVLMFLTHLAFPVGTTLRTVFWIPLFGAMFSFWREKDSYFAMRADGVPLREARLRAGTWFLIGCALITFWLMLPKEMLNNIPFFLALGLTLLLFYVFSWTEKHIKLWLDKKSEEFKTQSEDKTHG